MKSQRIKIRNLPIHPDAYEKTIYVRPTGILYMLMVIGVCMVFFRKYLLLLGASLVLLSLFGLLVLPDRKLLQFTNKFLIMYNCSDRTECTIVYWDEIVSWQYEYHNTYDQLVIFLTDGDTETQEVYSLHSLRAAMEFHAPGKMRRSVRIRRERT